MTVRTRPSQLARQQGRCWYCGIKMTIKKHQHKQPNYATWDHLTPRSRGGLNVTGNKRLACEKCNNHKANRTEGEYRKLLESQGQNRIWGDYIEDKTYTKLDTSDNKWKLYAVNPCQKPGDASYPFGHGKVSPIGYW